MKNTTSNTTKLLAISVMILGFFGSIALSIKFGNTYKLTTNGLETIRSLEKTALIVLIGILVTFIVGMLLYCLGEIIQKLQNIEYSLHSTNCSKDNEVDNFDQFIESLSDEEKSKIICQFKKGNP
jgi:predicted PurR-regulated permease PerM